MYSWQQQGILGAEVNVQDAGADTQEQISQIDYFIKKHMDVIVIIARDCSAHYRRLWSVPTAAGIRVISYDRMVNDADTDMYISFDNRKVGEIMAQSMDGSHSGRRKDLYDPGIRHR